MRGWVGGDVSERCGVRDVRGWGGGDVRGWGGGDVRGWGGEI